MEVNEEIGGYRLLRRLGSGGMGVVWEAVDGAGNRVALKLLHPHIAADDKARQRLAREAATIRRVATTGVAGVLDVETDATEAFVVTELIEGQSVEEDLANNGPWQTQDLLGLATTLADTLTRLHAVGVVHRDLKPGNIMLSESGPVLIDFGIAQDNEADRITQTGLVMGTPGYVAPELLSGADPGPAGDWWAWAAVLLTCATGRSPFGEGNLQAVLSRVYRGECDCAGLAHTLMQAFTRALNPDPHLRPSPDALVQALASCAVGQETEYLPEATTAEYMDRTQMWTPMSPHPQSQLPPPATGSPQSPPQSLPQPHQNSYQQVQTHIYPPICPPVYPDPSPDSSLHSYPHPHPQSRPYPYLQPYPPEYMQVPSPLPPDPNLSGTNMAIMPPELAPYPHQSPSSPSPARRPQWFLTASLALISGGISAELGIYGITLVLVTLVATSIIGQAEQNLHLARQRRGWPRKTDLIWEIMKTPWLAIRALGALLSALFLGGAVSWALWSGICYLWQIPITWQSYFTFVLHQDQGATLPELGAAVLAFTAAWVAAWSLPTLASSHRGIRATYNFALPRIGGRIVLAIIMLTAYLWWLQHSGLLSLLSATPAG